MFSDEDIMEIFPYPVKLELCTSSVVRLSFMCNRVTKDYNSNFEAKMPTIRYFYNVDMEDSEEGDYKIYIGNEVVCNGRLRMEEPFKKNEECLEKILKGIVFLYHDQIVKVIEKNNELLSKFEQEEYYELLYVYYRRERNPRNFFCLKKLADRYRNKTVYYKRLKNRYLSGNHNHRNIKMASKMTISNSDKF